MVTTRRSPATSPRSTAARPAAEDGSQKRPSSAASRRPRIDDLGVVDDDDPCAGAAHRRRMHRVADPDRGRHRVAAVDRLGRDDRHLEPELGERLRVGRGVPTPAVGQHECVGRAAELVEDLEDGGLLPCAAVGVERVDEDMRPPRAELLGCPERGVEVAADLEDRRPQHPRLRELRAGDGALRRQDERRQSGPRRIGGRARRGVPGRRADHRLGPGLERLRDGDRHAAVLVRARRVGRLPLQPQLAQAGGPRQAVGPEQRGRALAERHDRRRRRHRQALPEPFDEGNGHRRMSSRFRRSPTMPSPAPPRLAGRRPGSPWRRRARRAARRSPRARPRRGPPAPRA